MRIQVQHLELAREIVRRWTAKFEPEVAAARAEQAAAQAGGAASVTIPSFFPEPNPLLTPTRRLMGLDGQAKMSKSMGNTIGLLEPPDDIWAKLRPAVTDPKRVRRNDPGTPEVCNIYHLHKAFSPDATLRHVAEQCSSAGWGCLDCKRVLHENMTAELVPIQTRAAALRADPSLMERALDRGAERARAVAKDTMIQVKDMMGLAS